MPRPTALALLALLACKDDAPTDDSSAPTDDTTVEVDDTDDSTVDDTAPQDDTEAPVDEDGDGFSAAEDCDDQDATVYPGAAEVCGDGAVNDCDSDALTAAAGCRSVDDVDLSAGGVRLTGEANGDSAGWAVAGAGDLNGDGYADVAVGAPSESGTQRTAGSVYVVYGPVSAGSLAAADLQLVGEAQDDYAGYAVAAAGDVNHDGLADLVAGAIWNDEAGRDAGAVYLWSGPTGTGETNIVTGTARLLGAAAGDQAGFSVSAAGDVDGDGNDDLLVGANYSDGGAQDGGAAYVARGPLSGDSSLADAALVILGDEATGWLGYSVSGGHDVDGDGTPDALVGMPYSYVSDARAGAVMVFSGATTGTVSAPDADARLLGELRADYAGWSVASPGDVDGDGYGDALVGAPREDSAGNSAGAAYVVLGPLAGDMALSAAVAKLTGVAEDDRAGQTVAAAGDVDRDGRADVLVGAPLEGSGDRGSAYLLYGPVSGTASLADADVVLTGAASADQAGYALSGAGDVNGDGAGDLLIGGYKHAGDDTNSGAAWVVWMSTY
ncbi:MAG: FG-GAP repeat protein [Alphaproteobacteria bacterium]|nr:FG-GAP repeat protein [Alphaproteobacteria bacterium]